MARSSGRRPSGGDDSNQLHINWAGGDADSPTVATVTPVNTEPAAPALAESRTLVQRLKWDFKTSFPQPTDQAVDEGVIDAADLTPDAIRSIHEEHARQALGALHDLDVVMDAKRRGVDPRNNRKPMLAETKQRLQTFLETEPARLDRWYQTLMDTYADTVGADAADQFSKAIRAWHAGIQVVGDGQPNRPVRVTEPSGHAPGMDEPVEKPIKHRVTRRPPEQRRIIAVLPVPKPLPAAVAAGNFGQEENGKLICPGAHEVREITKRHVEKLIDLLDTIQLAGGSCMPTEAIRLQGLFDTALTAYAKDFGQHAANQLEAYVTCQAALDPSRRHER